MRLAAVVVDLHEYREPLLTGVRAVLLGRGPARSDRWRLRRRLGSARARAEPRRSAVRRPGRERSRRTRRRRCRSDLGVRIAAGAECERGERATATALARRGSLSGRLVRVMRAASLSICIASRRRPCAGPAILAALEDRPQAAHGARVLALAANGAAPKRLEEPIGELAGSVSQRELHAGGVAGAPARAHRRRACGCGCSCRHDRSRRSRRALEPRRRSHRPS